MRRPGLAYVELRMPQETAQAIDAAVAQTPGCAARTTWILALVERELARIAEKKEAN